MSPYTTRKYTIVIRSHVNRRISPYTVVYDCACSTWAVVLPPQQQSYSNPPTQASNQGQATEQHETTNNIEKLINLMVLSIKKQDEINQKLFNLTNRIIPIVEQLEKNLLPGEALNIEKKLHHNVTFRNKYCNKYNCFK
jgi:hypothetical protein